MTDEPSRLADDPATASRPEAMTHVDWDGKSRPRRANPSEKKAMAYARDHRIRGDHASATDRHKWPRKKALRNQTYRRHVTRSLAPVLGPISADIDEFSPTPTRRIKSRWTAWHWTTPLGKRVKRQQDRRLSSLGRKSRYWCCERNRARLVPLLKSLTEGRTEVSRRLARSFALLLDPPDVPIRAWSPERQDEVAINWYGWTGVLDRVLAEHPELDRRFRAWVAEMGGCNDGMTPSETMHPHGVEDRPD